MKKEDFVVVYGALRSGTTLLRLMLDKHPQLDCPGEVDFLFDFLSKSSDGHWQLDEDALKRDRIFQFSGAVVPEGKTPQEVVLNIIGQLRKSATSTIVLMVHRGLGEILEMFPDVRIVHMLRDPRDVARSSVGMGWAGTVYYGVSHWVNTENLWHAHCSKINPDYCQTLYFEELIRAPERELQSTVAFFGLTYTDAMLSYDEDSTYSAPDIKLIEQWRTKLSTKDVALVEGRIGSLLEKSGYAPGSTVPHKPNPVEAVTLGLQNKFATWHYRTSNFGLLDPIIVAVARRTNWRALGYRAQARINLKVGKLTK